MSGSLSSSPLRRLSRVLAFVHAHHDTPVLTTSMHSCSPTKCRHDYIKLLSLSTFSLLHSLAFSAHFFVPAEEGDIELELASVPPSHP